MSIDNGTTEWIIVWKSLFSLGFLFFLTTSLSV